MNHQRGAVGRGALRTPIIVVAIGGIPAMALSGGTLRGERRDSLRHDGPGAINHPVNLRPSSAVRIPSHWPLSPQGHVTCSTCHEQFPAASGAFLRDFDEARQDKSRFCVKCHVSGNGGGVHWATLRDAHWTRDSGSETNGVLLDAQTVSCLSCHDGVTAGEAHATRAVGGGVAYRGSGSADHPIGMEYGRRRSGGGGTSLKPASLLPASVRLPDGRVGCVSCHNLYNPSAYHLSVPIEGSALCFACHDMD